MASDSDRLLERAKAWLTVEVEDEDAPDTQNLIRDLAAELVEMTAGRDHWEERTRAQQDRALDAERGLANALATKRLAEEGLATLRATSQETEAQLAEARARVVHLEGWLKNIAEGAFWNARETAAYALASQAPEAVCQCPESGHDARCPWPPEPAAPDPFDCTDGHTEQCLARHAEPPAPVNWPSPTFTPTVTTSEARAPTSPRCDCRMTEKGYFHHMPWCPAAGRGGGAR